MSCERLTRDRPECYSASQLARPGNPLGDLSLGFHHQSLQPSLPEVGHRNHRCGFGHSFVSWAPRYALLLPLLGTRSWGMANSTAADDKCQFDHTILPVASLGDVKERLSEGWDRTILSTRSPALGRAQPLISPRLSSVRQQQSSARARQ